MSNQRYRPVVQAVAAIAGVWLLAGAGYRSAQRFEITTDQVLAYEQSVDFSALSGADRDAALRKLEGMIGVLSLVERQQVWSDVMAHWFAAMTEAERAQFLATTALPGFKQTPNPFDLLPPDRRQQAIDDTLKKLRETRAQSLSGAPANHGASPPSSGSK